MERLLKYIIFLLLKIPDLIFKLFKIWLILLLGLVVGFFIILGKLELLFESSHNHV